MNPMLFSLWLLVSYIPGPHVVERFRDFQDCEAFRKQIEVSPDHLNKYEMVCIRATIAR